MEILVTSSAEETFILKEDKITEETTISEKKCIIWSKVFPGFKEGTDHFAQAHKEQFEILSGAVA